MKIFMKKRTSPYVIIITGLVIILTGSYQSLAAWNCSELCWSVLGENCGSYTAYPWPSCMPLFSDEVYCGDFPCRYCSEGFGGTKNLCLTCMTEESIPTYPYCEIDNIEFICGYEYSRVCEDWGSICFCTNEGGTYKGSCLFLTCTNPQG